MSINENHYRAYLVRFQRSDEHAHWRVTMQNAQTGEVVQFASERQLLSFLINSLQM